MLTVAIVPLALATGKPIRLLQLPRVRQTENARRLPVEPGRKGREEGARAGTGRFEAAADDEGMSRGIQGQRSCGGTWVQSMGDG